MEKKSSRYVIWGARIALGLLLFFLAAQFVSICLVYGTLDWPVLLNSESMAVSKFYLYTILSMAIWSMFAVVLYLYKKYWLVMFTLVIVFVVNPFIVRWFFE